MLGIGIRLSNHVYGQPSLSVSDVGISASLEKEIDCEGWVLRFKDPQA